MNTAVIPRPADMEPVACLCGANSPAERSVTAVDEGSGETFQYLACPACTLQRLSPRPVLSAIGAYYPQHYAPHVGPVPAGPADRLKRLAYEVFWAPPAEQTENVRRFRPLLQLLLRPIRYRTVLAFDPPAHRRVFEFGAAKATDLIAFRNAGWAVEGCEPSEQACALAAQQGIHLQNATAETATLPDAAFTAILFNNVFEHIHDPVGVLQTCYRALQPGGVLMVIVPNHDALTPRLFGAAWPGYDAPRHLWGWTPAAIEQQFARAGFKVEYIHQQFTGAWLWQSTLDMRHAPRKPGPLRRWIAHHAPALGLPFSLIAAAVGHGDFMRVVARKE